MTTVVVTQQPSVIHVQQVTVNRQWSTGLFGCFEDLGSCLYALLCPCCFTSKVKRLSGEGCTCCVPGDMIATRMKVRTRLHIQGSLCNDCITDYFCGPCSACQMYREIHNSANGQLY